MEPLSDLEKVWRRLQPGAPDECWEWPGCRTPKGYGTVSRHTYVHRVVMGVTDRNSVVRHTCDNPPCCNPAHLAVGTAADNMADMVARKRSNTGEKHWNVKLTDAQVATIIADPRPSTQVAPEYGVSARYVRKLRQGTRRRC